MKRLNESSQIHPQLLDLCWIWTCYSAHEGILSLLNFLEASPHFKSWILVSVLLHLCNNVWNDTRKSCQSVLCCFKPKGWNPEYTCWIQTPALWLRREQTQQRWWSTDSMTSSRSPATFMELYGHLNTAYLPFPSEHVRLLWADLLRPVCKCVLTKVRATFPPEAKHVHRCKKWIPVGHL